MNRVVIGAATLLLLAGLVIFVSRSVGRLNLGKIVSRPTASPSFSPLPIFSPLPSSTPTVQSGTTGTILLPQSGVSELPATGL